MKERTKERRKERTHVHVISMCNYHASYTAHITLHMDITR